MTDTPTLARATHLILFVRDQERSRAFYEVVFGAAPRLHVPGMTEFALGGGAVLGLMPEASPVLPRDWGDEAGYCLDPDGHVLAFAAPARRTTPGVALRPFDPETDVPTVTAWLHRADVRRWWGDPDVAPAALAALCERLRAAGARVVGLASAVANGAALAAYTKAGFVPYRDFVENGEPYRYWTRTLAQDA